MAKSPQKSNNPTQDALDAIQDALKQDAIKTGENDKVLMAAAAAEPPAEPPPPHPAAETFGDDLLRPANDDRVAIGQILQSLRRRPARAPYVVAGAASAVWLAGALATLYLYRADLPAWFAAARAGFAITIAAAATVIVPIVFFF